MKTLVDGLPAQIVESIEIAESTQLNPSKKEIRNVCISGLGGSGIGGTIVSQLTANEARFPIYVNKDYHIPAFVNEHTLFVASSYSGNTEETLMALEKAEAAGAEIACITSGGKLLETAKSKGYNVIVIPGGLPPRAAFGYSSIQQFKLLEHYGITTGQPFSMVKKVPALMESEKENLKTIGMEIAKKLHNRIPVIYSEAGFEGACVRFRQQINENSKMLAWHHVLPEMNHNELVGWVPGNDETAVVMFRNETDFSRTQERMNFSLKRMVNSASSVTEVWSKGANNIERAYYLMYLGDWVSVFLAELQDIDAVEVDIITELKDKLAEI